MPADETTRAAAMSAEPRMALDPATTPQALAGIAEHRPDLRALVAINPAANPGLLDWLANLGDPVVDAALTTRTPAPTPASPPTISVLPPPSAQPASASGSELGSLQVHPVWPARAPVGPAQQAADAQDLMDPDIDSGPPSGRRPSLRAAVVAAGVIGVVALIVGGILVSGLLAAPEAAVDTEGSAQEGAVPSDVTPYRTIALPGDRAPSALALDPEAGLVYTASPDEGSVCVIDIATLEVTATIPVGQEPTAMVFDPSRGELYVAVGADQAVAVIDTETHRVIDRIAIEGGYLHDLALDPSSGEVFAANGPTYSGDPLAGTVSVIDTASRTVVETIATFGATDVAVLPSTQELYVSNGWALVRVIDSGSRRITHELSLAYSGDEPAQTADITADDATGRVYVSNQGGGSSIWVIDSARHTFTEMIDTGGRPGRVALDERAGSSYVLNRRDGMLVALDSDTNEVVRALPVGYGADALVVHPATGAVYVGVRGPRAALVVVRPDIAGDTSLPVGGSAADREEMIGAIRARGAQEQIPGTPTYSLAVGSDGTSPSGRFAFFLVDEATGQALKGTPRGVEELNPDEVEVANGVVVSAEGYDMLTRSEINDARQTGGPLELFAVPTDDGIIRSQGFRAVVVSTSVEYDPTSDTITDTETGTVYRAIRIGDLILYADTEGRLAPS